jgi:TATA box-binding protein binding
MLTDDEFDQLGAMDFNENCQLIEDDEENSEFNLTGFSFGNIDADGKLDANFLDAEAQRQLSSLGKFGLLSIVNDITEEENRSVCSHREEIVTKSPSAEDFSDICEVIEVDPCPVVGDSSLMPPPVVPVITNKVVHRVKRNVKTPLASLLPSRYADVDVQEMFPHFEPGKILRFSKIFPPARPPIWHRVTKPRKQLDDFTAKTEQNREIKLNVGPAAPLDQCDTILEDKFLKPLDSDGHSDEGEDPNTSDSNEPGTGTSE